MTADPAAAVAAGVETATIVAVALPALATGFGPSLPEGALDGAAEVRTRGDVFLPLVEPAPGDEALAVAGGPALAHDELLAAAAEAARTAGLAPRPRLLTTAGPDAAVETLLAPLLLDGSVVLHAPGLEPAEVERIAVQEQVTDRSLR